MRLAVKKKVVNVEPSKQKIKTEVAEFSREQILAAGRYKDRRDIVAAILDKDKRYTFETVDALIEEYMKGQVR